MRKESAEVHPLALRADECAMLATLTKDQLIRDALLRLQSTFLGLADRRDAVLDNGAQPASLSKETS